MANSYDSEFWTRRDVATRLTLDQRRRALSVLPAHFGSAPVHAIHTTGMIIIHRSVLHD